MVDKIGAINGLHTQDDDPLKAVKKEKGNVVQNDPVWGYAIKGRLDPDKLVEIRTKLNDEDPNNDFEEVQIGNNKAVIKYSKVDNDNAVKASYQVIGEIPVKKQVDAMSAIIKPQLAEAAKEHYDKLITQLMDPRKEVSEKAAEELENVYEEALRAQIKKAKALADKEGRTFPKYTDDDIRDLKKHFIDDMKNQYRLENTEFFLPYEFGVENGAKDYRAKKAELKKEQADAQKRFDDAVAAGKEPDPNDIKILNKKVKKLSLSADFIMKHKDEFFEEGKFNSDKFKDFAMALNDGQYMNVDARGNSTNRMLMNATEAEREAQRRLAGKDAAELETKAAAAQKRLDAAERVKKIDEAMAKNATGAELNDEEKALLIPAEADFKAAKARLEAGERIKAIEAIRAKGDAATEEEKALLPASLQEYALAVSRIATDQAQEGDAELVRIYGQYDADLKVRPQAGDAELVKKYEQYQADKAIAVTENDQNAVKEYEQYKQDLETVRKAMDDGFWGLGLLRKGSDGKLHSARKHGNEQYVILKEAGLGAELNWKKPTMAALSTLVTLAGSAVAGYAASKLTNACAEAFADSFAETFTDAAANAICEAGELSADSVANAFAEATAKAGAWASSKATVTGILDSALAAAGSGYIFGNLNRIPDGKQIPTLDGNGIYIANEEVQYEGEVVVEGCPTVDPGPSPEPSVAPTPTTEPNDNSNDCEDCPGGAVKVNIPKAIKVSAGRNKGLLFETIAKSYEGYDKLSPSEKKRFRIQLRKALAKMAGAESLDNLKSGVNYLCVNFEFTKADGTKVTYFLNEKVQDDENYFKDKVQEYSTNGTVIEKKTKSPCDDKKNK